MVQFFCETSLLFCFFLPGSESSLVYIIFQILAQILKVTPPTNTLRVDMPPSSMPPTQFMCHFCWGTTCILFILGNRYTSCYAIHATYTAFLLGNKLYPVYFRKLVHFCYATYANYASCQRSSSQ